MYSFRSRGEKILSLVPIPGIGSDDEAEDDGQPEDENRNELEDILNDWNEAKEENLEAAISRLFEDICIPVEDDENEDRAPDASIENSKSEEAAQDEPEEHSQLQQSNEDLGEKAPTTKAPRNKRRTSKPAFKVGTLGKKRKMKRLQMKWTASKFLHSVSNKLASSLGDSLTSKTALSYFYQYFDNKCIDLIVYQSNLYYMQQKGEPLKLDRDTLKSFIGILLLMGIVHLPAVTDYWSANPCFKQEFISKVMSYRKFVRIKRFIHFANNSQDNKEDPFYKIRPIFELIRQNCLQTPPENSYSIDEMMIPYKGKKAGSNKQYMPKKPCKWGFKMLVRSGVSGIAYDFYLYSGAFTFSSVDFSETEATFPFSSQCVMALCKSINDPAMNSVYFDNFFTSPELMVHLRRNYGILTVGTIRRNRTRGAPISSENTMKKKKSEGPTNKSWTMKIRS